MPGWSGNLVNGADVLADRAARHLAGDEEYGRGAGVRIGQAGGGVVESRSRYHQGYPRSPGCPGVAVRHVRRGLLVPGRDHADARLVPQRRYDPVDLYAGYPENDLDAFRCQRFD